MQNVCPRMLANHIYVYSELDCVRHLFNVVSGLNSMVLGETEIVSQLKQAMVIASDNSSLGTHLSGLMQMSLSVAKDVRNMTEINNVAISMGNAITNLVAESFIQLENEAVLFVGAGQMMQQIAPHFMPLNIVKKTVINRSVDNACQLAQRVGANVVSLTNLADIIVDYSIIVSCANSDKPLITEDLLEASIKSQKKLLIVDVSVPLISDISLRKHDNIQLITVDDIASIVDVGLDKRKIAAQQAHSIIEGKLLDYQQWLKKRTMAPLIKAIRDDAESVRQEALTNAQKLLQNGEAPDDVLRQFSMQLMNKLLHNPTVNLCSSSGMQQEDLLDLVGYLYGVNVVAPHADL